VHNRLIQNLGVAMHNKILLIGSVLFASQVVFAETLTTPPKAIEITTTASHSFEQSISTALIAKGLDESVAQHRAKESVLHMQSAPVLTHILSRKLQIEAQDIHTYIASKALFQKSVDLRSYSDIMRMVQQIKGLAVGSQETQAIEEYMAVV